MNGNEVSLARALRGPVTLITLGVLFAMNNFTTYQFRETWPVLLIVFGLMSLLRRTTEPLPPPAPPMVQPGANWPPAPVQQSGTYRQTNYPDAGTPPPAGGAA